MFPGRKNTKINTSGGNIGGKYTNSNNTTNSHNYTNKNSNNKKTRLSLSIIGIVAFALSGIGFSFIKIGGLQLMSQSKMEQHKVDQQDSNSQNNNSSNKEIISNQTPSNSSPTPITAPTPSSDFQEVALNCSQQPGGSQQPVGKFIDLEFPQCAQVKNYSNNWYEIEGQGGVFLLIPPGEDFLIPDKFLYSEGNYSKVKVKQHLGNPVRTVTVKCDGEPIDVWRIALVPKCNSTGTYIGVESAVMYPTKITLDNGQSLAFNVQFGGSRGQITSGSRSVDLTFSVGQ